MKQETLTATSMPSLTPERIVIPQHDDMMHDAVLDYYGKRLATCSSDATIKIFDTSGEQQTLVASLTGHDGPVWQIAWAHPMYGVIIASAGYDGNIMIWEEKNGKWTNLAKHSLHQASVNSVSWAPHELGAILLCASSDGKISIIELRADGSWDIQKVQGHSGGCNAASWAPCSVPGSLIADLAASKEKILVRSFVSAGCDNLCKIWEFDSASNQWLVKTILEGHKDWVRDVAWAPNIGLSRSYVASAGQDKMVYIFSRDLDGEWKREPLLPEGFSDIAWRVSWSHSGNNLAVSCGNNCVYIFSRGADGWKCDREINSST